MLSSACCLNNTVYMFTGTNTVYIFAGMCTNNVMFLVTQFSFDYANMNINTSM